MVKPRRIHSFPNDHARFMSYVDASSGPAACHLWTGSSTQNPGDNRGRFWIDNGYQSAPRWLLGYLRGRPLEYGAEEACHTCDNPICVNPDHLYVGDRSSNMRDMADRKRNRNSRKTHCNYGHQFSPENTMVITNTNGRPSRICRICHARRRADFEARHATA